MAFGSPLVGRQAGDRLFDPVEIADPVEGLLGDRRAVGGMDIEEFAADMSPAGGLGDPIAREQPLEPGIGVGVDDTAEGLQMRLWVFALAVGRVEEQRRRRSRAGERPLVANIEPALAKAGVHSRPVLVLPVPGANTGNGVSSTCSVSDPITSAASALTSGCSAAAVARPSPTGSRFPG